MKSLTASTLKMQALSSSEMTLIIYQLTRQIVVLSGD